MHIATGKASNITIATHTHPDGDAVGSSLGLLHYLEAAGKNVRIVLSDGCPDSLGFLTEKAGGSISVLEENGDMTRRIIRESDLLFCLDMNSFSRAEALESDLESAGCPKILIDHHPEPDKGSFDMVFSMTGISSTSELMYYILMAMPDIDGDASRLPAGTREALMTGMTTDTNNFANSVYPSTFDMASGLIEAGTDRDAILSALYNCGRENRFRLMGTLLKDNMTITPDGVAYMIIASALARQYDIREGETEGFVNLPLGIKNVRMSILVREEPERFRISIRSKRGIPANICARRYFNGGGHELAAGGRLIKGPDTGETPEEVAGYIEKSTRMFFNETADYDDI